MFWSFPGPHYSCFSKPGFFGSNVYISPLTRMFPVAIVTSTRVIVETVVALTALANWGAWASWLKVCPRNKPTVKTDFNTGIGLASKTKIKEWAGLAFALFCSKLVTACQSQVRQMMNDLFRVDFSFSCMPKSASTRSPLPLPLYDRCRHEKTSRENLLKLFFFFF